MSCTGVARVGALYPALIDKAQTLYSGWSYDGLRRPLALTAGRFDFSSVRPPMRFCPCVAALCITFFSLPTLATAKEERSLLMLSGGVAGVLDSEINPVISAEYRFGPSWHGLRAWLGASWATDGAIFLGGGPVYTLEFAQRKWALAAGCGPGYYERHEGTDLGSHLEFYSFVEISRILPNGHRVGLRGLHISNGGLTERNPGAELLMLGYAIPLP